MKKKWIRSFKVASVYVGVILGAGFASGQEIMKFFIQYGQNGFLGLILSGLLFSLTGWAVLDLTYAQKFTNSHELLSYVMGDVLGNIMEFISGIFMFILFCAMLAASGALAKEAFGASETFGILIMGVISFVTLLFGIEGIIAINVVLSPILVLGGIVIGVYAFIMHKAPTFSFLSFVNSRNWVFSAITYVSYNIITAISVLSALKNEIDCKKTAFTGSFLGGGVMGLLGICLGIPLFFHFDSVKYLELPMFGVLNQYGKLVTYVFMAVLTIAIYTTSVANYFGIMKWSDKKIKTNALCKALVFVTLACIAAHIGFSNFVGSIYPIFGYIGLFEIIMLLLNFAIRHCKKNSWSS